MSKEQRRLAMFFFLGAVLGFINIIGALLMGVCMLLANRYEKRK